MKASSESTELQSSEFLKGLQLRRLEPLATYSLEVKLRGHWYLHK